MARYVYLGDPEIVEEVLSDPLCPTKRLWTLLLPWSTFAIRRYPIFEPCLPVLSQKLAPFSLEIWPLRCKHCHAQLQLFLAGP